MTATNPSTFSLHLTKLAIARKWEARINRVGGSVEAFWRNGGATVTLPCRQMAIQLGNELAALPCAGRWGFVTISFPGEDDVNIAHKAEREVFATGIVTRALQQLELRKQSKVRREVINIADALRDFLDFVARQCVTEVLLPAAVKFDLIIEFTMDDVFFRELPTNGDKGKLIHYTVGESEVEPHRHQELCDAGLDVALDALQLTLPNGSTMAAYIADARKRGVL